jgi:Peptidase A4 family
MSRNSRESHGLDRHRGYDPPPAGFDPLVAPDELLLRHGLPRRPDPQREPGLARLWERAFGRPLTFVKAKLEIDRRLRDRNPLQGKDAEFGPNNWAAAVVRAGGPFSWVFAEWVIPEVPKKGVFADDVTIGFWVGLDGVTMGDDQVLQAGVRVTMHTQWWFWPHVVVDWKAWTEWWVKGIESTDPVYLANFPVKPGDTVSFLVCAPRPDSLAWVNILNTSTGQHTTVDVPTPVGNDGVPVTLQGDSAEWAVEVVEPAAPNLPQFDPITFDDCWAGHGEPTFSAVGLSSADELNIAGPSGDLTDVQIVPPHTASVRRT